MFNEQHQEVFILVQMFLQWSWTAFSKQREHLSVFKCTLVKEKQMSLFHITQTTLQSVNQLFETAFHKSLCCHQWQ